MRKHIVIPLDGGVFAEGALPLLDQVAASGDMVTLLRVVHATPPSMLVHASGREPMLEDLQGRVPLMRIAIDNPELEAASTYLDPIAARLRARGLDVRCVVREGTPAEEIVDVAREATMIIMTTHAREGLARALLGSVAHKVVQHGHVPVMLIRPEPFAGQLRNKAQDDGMKQG